MSKKILVLPGDGIGKEVTAQAVRIIEWLNANKNTSFVLDYGLIGGSAYDETGSPLPQETIDKAKASNAILLGAVGGPKWEPLDISVRPEKGLLGIRKALGLFANLRPAIVFKELADASTLKPEVVAGLDIMILRELTGGLYFGQPRGVEDLGNGQRRGFNTLEYTTMEIQRIGRVAFELARKRNGRVCSVDKANVLECTEFWREEMKKLHDAEYPDVELTHMYVDNAAMQLVRNPKQFDVMVTENMFGDILSDCASMLTGSLGMLPSASLGEAGTPGLYEPVHGSAPDIADQNIANPIATILSLAMMLRYSFNMGTEADLVENAIKQVLADGYRTGDIMQEGASRVGTSQMGDAIVKALGVAAKAAA
ncbi:MAG: Isocitrate/isopropylmalate dehydrogenase [Rickettsiaceae bacterium]|jgi:3-isopropylmalate dehydrogenase|nr:Isocitrate/isopropylmalate dehydrogenase [Rickettsiaceae bacterium]